MQFLVYIAVVLLSLGGILVELDWLTKPKLETKSPAQVASTAVPVRTVPKVDGPTEGPSPVYATKPEAEQVTEAPVPADQTAAAETNGAAPQPEAQPQVQPQAQPVQATAKQAPNRCDVQGCASAYQSFRASDCTYQPMEGPRKFCEKPPAANQRITSAPRDPRLEPTARRPSRDAELRDVERAVRSIRVGDETGYDSRMGRSEVIVIERSERDW